MSGQTARVSAPITNSRSIIWTKPGTTEHFLKVKNNDPYKEWIELPLGKIPSRPKGQHEKDYNVFANIFPLRYLTAEHRSDQAGILRPGWLYVFLNGKLWRELQVHGQGKMSDIDPAGQRGKDVRKATSLGKCSVIVPHKIAGREQTVEMAYSEVQWSWARVQKLESDAALRQKRMQTVCLAQRTGGYQPFGPQGTKAKVQHVGLAYKELQACKSPEAHWLKGSKDEPSMPVVYLDDPLGVARSLGMEACRSHLLLDELIRTDGHQRTVAGIVECVLESYPDSQKHVRWEDMKSFSTNFDASHKMRTDEYDTAQKRLVSFLNKPQEGDSLVVRTVWSDYDQALFGHQEELEGVWLSLLAGISPMAASKGKEAKPDFQTQLLGENLDTAEGLLLKDRVLLGSDRLTGYTDNLVGLIAGKLPKEKLKTVTEQVLKRYRASGIKVEQRPVEIAIVPAHMYPKDVRWGAAVDSAGKPVRIGAGGKIVVPQLFVNGKPIQTIEETVKIANVDVFEKTTRTRQVSVPSRALTYAEATRWGLRGLQAYNLSVAYDDFVTQWKGGSDIATRMVYLANLTSDAAGLAAMLLEPQKVRSGMAQALKWRPEAIATLSISLAITSNVLLSVYESKMAYDEWQAGDRDAAVGRGAMALGGLMLASKGAGTLLAATATSQTTLIAAGTAARLMALSRAFMVLGGPKGIAVGLVISGLLWYFHSDNNPMEDWLAHCCWGTKSYKGTGNIVGTDGQKQSIDYVTWKNEPGKEIQAVLPLLIGFSAQAAWVPDSRSRQTVDCRNGKVTYEGSCYFLRVTAPPLKDGRVIAQIRAHADGNNWHSLLGADVGEDYYRRLAPRILNSREAASPQAVIHEWTIRDAIFPKNCKRIEAKVWFDPFGDGRRLIPHALGVSLTVKSGETANASSV